MHPAAKKIILVLWLVLFGVATASASIPRTSENRVWENFSPAQNLHQAESLQIVESHPDEIPLWWDLASNQTVPVNLMDPFGLGPVSALVNGMQSVFSAGIDLIGKAWNLPNTVVGLVWGGIGLATGANVTFGNNAVQFENHPLMLFGAITLGNTIHYPSGFGPSKIGEHEKQHTIQGQQLGPLYLLSNALGLSLAQMFDQDTHGPTNWNERGPQSEPPRPW